MLTATSFEGSGIPPQKVDHFVLPLLHSSGVRTDSDLADLCSSPKQQSNLLQNGLPLAFLEAIVLHFSAGSDTGEDLSLKAQVVAALREVGALLNFSSSSSSPSPQGSNGNGPRMKKQRRVVSLVFIGAALYCLLLTLSFFKTERIESIRPMEESAARMKCEQEEPAAIEAPPHIKFVHTLPSKDNSSEASGREVVKQLDPVSPNGVICVRGSWGRLNNNLIEVKNAFWFAYQLNRTVVVMNRVSGIYDIEKLQNVRPHASYRIALSYSSSLCKHGTYFKEGGHYKKNDDVLPKRTMTSRWQRKRELEKLREYTKNIKVMQVAAYYLYYFQMHDHGFDRAFFSNLWPLERYESKARAFIQDTYGSRPFVAVHLRDLEGSCGYRMRRDYKIGRKVCNPYLSKTVGMMERLVGRKTMEQLNYKEIFVASDHQNRGALSSYTEDPGYNNHQFKGKCKGYICAIIEFEIAARSSFFVGTLASTASHTISVMRELRQTHNGIHYPSVMWFQGKSNHTIEDYERHSCLV